MKVPYFRYFPVCIRLWIHPYFLSEEAEIVSAKLVDAYKYDRFRVWRWMGAL